MSNIKYPLIYFISCALHEKNPDSEKIKNVDMNNLLKISKYHSLTGIICYALESAGINDEKFQKEKNLAIRNLILLDAERKQICKFLEENKIWYMPLKGVYMKEYYPKIGMRQMCDNDIIIDENGIEIVDKWMLGRGYSKHDESKHDYSY